MAAAVTSSATERSDDAPEAGGSKGYLGGGGEGRKVLGLGLAARRRLARGRAAGAVQCDADGACARLRHCSCEAGELLEPFFLVNIWLILRLDQWDGARLDAAMREELIEDLFEQWLDDRVSELLAGRTPGLLPTHLLEGV